jgi:cyanophycin synthetase
MTIESAKAGNRSRSAPGTTPALPIVAISGTRGKSTVSWLLDAILNAAEMRTGIWTTAGVFMQGEHLVGELGPWSDVVTALLRGELDAAVQELENPVITGVGLPPHTYSLAAIVSLCGNNDQCLISSEAAQGAAAQEIVARAVRPDGNIVLNADDLAVLEAADSTDAGVTLFALHRDNPSLRRHREQGGTAVWLEGTVVTIGHNGDEIPILDSEIARFTLDNSLTFQVQNLLCAVALAWHLEIPTDAMRDGISSFQPDPELMPGSCNIIHNNGSTILLDAARQVWTVRSLVRGIRDSAFNRTIVVSHCFCHLPADQISNAGRLIGRVADVVVTHRANGASDCLEHFKEGLARNDVPPLVFAMPSEQNAINRALQMLNTGDLCLLLTPNVAEAISLIRRS